MVFMWMFERFSNVVKYKNNLEELEKLQEVYKFTTKLEPRFSKAFVKFETFAPEEINSGFFNCRLDMELAVFANVSAFYFSNMEDYDAAGFLYAIASCFLYNKKEVRIRVLKNLQTCYKRQYLEEKSEILDLEIQKLEQEIDMTVVENGEIFHIAS